MTRGISLSAYRRQLFDGIAVVAMALSGAYILVMVIEWAERGFRIIGR